MPFMSPYYCVVQDAKPAEAILSPQPAVMTLSTATPSCFFLPPVQLQRSSDDCLESSGRRISSVDHPLVSLVDVSQGDASLEFVAFDPPESTVHRSDCESTTTTVSSSRDSPSDCFSSPLLALDPKDFVQAALAKRREKIRKFVEEEAKRLQQQHVSQKPPGAESVPCDNNDDTTALLAIRCQTVDTDNNEPPTESPPPLPTTTTERMKSNPRLPSNELPLTSSTTARRVPPSPMQPFSLPRSAFSNDADFVTYTLQRFLVSDNDIVDFERGTWRPRQ